jgi:hypothetical protein
MATMKMTPPANHGGFSHGGVEVRLNADGTLDVPPALYDKAREMGYADYQEPKAAAPAPKAASEAPAAFDPKTAKRAELMSYLDDQGIDLPADVSTMNDLRTFVIAQVEARVKDKNDNSNPNPNPGPNEKK